MPPTRKFPYSILYQTGDRASFKQLAKDTRPAAIGVINDVTLLVETLAICPDAIVGYFRPYPPDSMFPKDWTRKGDEALWRLGSAKCIEYYTKKWREAQSAGLTDPRAAIYVFNQPAPPVDKDHPNYITELTTMMQVICETIEALNAIGARCIAFNGAGASFEQWTLDRGFFDRLIRLCQNGQNYLGGFSYGGPIPPTNGGGRNVLDALDKAKCQEFGSLEHPDMWWVGPYNMQVDGINSNWLIGRIFWWIRRAYQIGVGNKLRVLLVESGTDRIPNLEELPVGGGKTIKLYQELEQRYKRKEFRDGQWRDTIVPWPFISMEGIHTVRRVWLDYFGDAVRKLVKEESDYDIPGTDVDPEQDELFAHIIIRYMKWQQFTHDDRLYFQQQAGNIPNAKPEDLENIIIGIIMFEWCTGNEWAGRGFDWSATTPLMRHVHQLMRDWSAEWYAVTPPPPPTPEPPVVEPPPTPDPEPPVTPPAPVGNWTLQDLVAELSKRYTLDEAIGFLTAPLTLANIASLLSPDTRKLAVDLFAAQAAYSEQMMKAEQAKALVYRLLEDAFSDAQG